MKVRTKHTWALMLNTRLLARTPVQIRELGQSQMFIALKRKAFFHKNSKYLEQYPGSIPTPTLGLTWPLIWVVLVLQKIESSGLAVLKVVGCCIKRMAFFHKTKKTYCKICIGNINGYSADILAPSGLAPWARIHTSWLVVCFTASVRRSGRVFAKNIVTTLPFSRPPIRCIVWVSGSSGIQLPPELRAAILFSKCDWNFLGVEENSSQIMAQLITHVVCVCLLSHTCVLQKMSGQNQLIIFIKSTFIQKLNFFRVYKRIFSKGGNTIQRMYKATYYHCLTLLYLYSKLTMFDAEIRSFLVILKVLTPYYIIWKLMFKKYTYFYTKVTILNSYCVLCMHRSACTIRDPQFDQ